MLNSKRIGFVVIMTRFVRCVVPASRSQNCSEGAKRQPCLARVFLTPSEQFWYLLADVTSPTMKFGLH